MLPICLLHMLQIYSIVYLYSVSTRGLFHMHKHIKHGQNHCDVTHWVWTLALVWFFESEVIVRMLRASIGLTQTEAQTSWMISIAQRAVILVRESI